MQNTNISSNLTTENIINNILQTGKNMTIPSDGYKNNTITIKTETFYRIINKINDLHEDYVKRQHQIAILKQKLHNLESTQCSSIHHDDEIHDDLKSNLVLSSNPYVVTKLFDCKTGLGECPIWDDQKKILCWLSGDIWSTYNPITKELSIFTLPEPAGSFALCKNTTNTDIYIFAFKTSGVCFYNPYKAKILHQIFDFVNIDNKIHPTRLNDGKCDKYGNFIVGGLNCLRNIYDKNLPISNVYRINKDLTYKKILENVSNSNSICFGLRGDKMYFTDSRVFLPRKIVCYPYYENCNNFPIDRRTEEENFCIWDKNKCGTPDGSMIDRFGYLWNCEFHGGKVTRYNQNGDVDMVIDLKREMDNAYVTGCCFGGENLDVLFITCGKGYDEGYIYAVKFNESYGVKEDRFHGECPIDSKL